MASDKWATLDSSLAVRIDVIDHLADLAEKIEPKNRSTSAVLVIGIVGWYMARHPEIGYRTPFYREAEGAYWVSHSANRSWLARGGSPLCAVRLPSRPRRSTIRCTNAGNSRGP